MTHLIAVRRYNLDDEPCVDRLFWSATEGYSLQQTGGGMPESTTPISDTYAAQWLCEAPEQLTDQARGS